MAEQAKMEEILAARIAELVEQVRVTTEKAAQAEKERDEMALTFLSGITGRSVSQMLPVAGVPWQWQNPFGNFALTTEMAVRQSTNTPNSTPLSPPPTRPSFEFGQNGARSISQNFHPSQDHSAQVTIPEPSRIRPPGDNQTQLLFSYSSPSDMVILAERVEQGTKLRKIETAPHGALHIKEDAGFASHQTSFGPPFPPPPSYPSPSLYQPTLFPSLPGPVAKIVPQYPTPFPSTPPPIPQPIQTKRHRPRNREPLPPLPLPAREIFKHLLAAGQIAPIPTRPPQTPYPKWYDHNARCEYHAGARGHTLEKCFAFKEKIHHLIERGWLSFEGLAKGPNTIRNPPSNPTPGVNDVLAREVNDPLPLMEMPKAVLFFALAENGHLPHSGNNLSSCLFCPGASKHEIQNCELFGEKVKQFVDLGVIRFEMKTHGIEAVDAIEDVSLTPCSSVQAIAGPSAPQAPTTFHARGIKPLTSSDSSPKEVSPRYVPPTRNEKPHPPSKYFSARYDKGDPEIGTLGQPSGKFDYLVKYSAPPSYFIIPPSSASWELPESESYPSPTWPSPPLPLKEIYASLLATGEIVPSPVSPQQPPYPSWYDAKARCEYHAEAQGHSLEDCFAFREKVDHLTKSGRISSKSLSKGLDTITNPLSNHAQISEEISVISTKQIEDSLSLVLGLPRERLFAALVKSGHLPHSEDGLSACLFCQRSSDHEIRSCGFFVEKLKQLVDFGVLQTERRTQGVKEVGAIGEGPPPPYMFKGVAQTETPAMTPPKLVFKVAQNAPNPDLHAVPLNNESTIITTPPFIIPTAETFKIGGTTRTGKCYLSKEVEKQRQARGKGPLVSEEIIEKAQGVNEPIAEGDAAEFLRIMRRSRINSRHGHFREEV